MNSTILKQSKELIGLALVVIFIYLFIFLDYNTLQKEITIPKEWLNVNTIFLSIVIEAIPFILLGVFVSSLIQIFVSEETLKKYIPKNPIVAVLPAALLGAIFPVCECAIVPVVRRLIKKGMPLHVAFVFLACAPILNPVVAASTYFAFKSNTSILIGRMGLAFVLSMAIGLVLYIFFKNSNQLKVTSEELVGKQQTSSTQMLNVNRLKATLYHASDEFFDMGKYLIIGALIASLFQTFLDRNVLLSMGSNEFTSPLVMMGFAFILSLCSEADAFVASSFGSTFAPGALLAFLVYGPMLDLKNTIMLFAYFRLKFVFSFILVATAVVYIGVIIYQSFVL
ncbi:permease [Metabacillus sediminilitoris]|uniref:Permease n=1 Tax=Metabacillus sediminilitoris TaxID=2567941 RepID=A0A4S4BQ15_9BACI|nr:permease [Metabacillus sediminilitoris]QGQ48349.1 permease [Metabacillus sediminilitoris]THF77005.1 permease [Metabacillus sediminilitoris]